MTRQARLQALRTLISQGDYRTQASLVDALVAQDFQVTQSSLSRDIHTLKLEKVDGVYALPTPTPTIELPTLDHPAFTRLLTITPTGDHMLVLLVQTASAQLVAAAIDSLDIPGVAGTIAGDDTVFVAITDGHHLRALAQSLRTTAGL